MAAKDGTGKAGDAAKDDLSNLTYQQASDELERVVRQLESSQGELEESLALYQRGVALVRELRARLDDATQKVTVLMGQIEATDEEAHDSTLS